MIHHCTSFYHISHLIPPQNLNPSTPPKTKLHWLIDSLYASRAPPHAETAPCMVTSEFTASALACKFCKANDSFVHFTNHPVKIYMSHVLGATGNFISTLLGIFPYWPPRAESQTKVTEVSRAI